MVFGATIREFKELFLCREVMLHLLVCVVWASVLLGYARGIINRLPVLGEYTDQVEAAMVVLPLLLSLPLLANKFTLFDYGFVLLFLFYYALTYVTHTENTPYLNKFAFDCLCLSLPGYFIGRIIDIEKYFHTFVALSVICALMVMAYFAVYAQSAKNMADVAGADNMETAYSLLPHVLMLTWASLRKFNPVTSVVAFAGIVFLLSCGTRGPLFCAGMFGIVYFLFFMNFRYSYAVKAFLLAFSSLFILFMNEILAFLIYFFTDLSLSTRVLDKFLSGELGHDSGRGWLRGLVWRNLDVHGDFFGLGLFGSKVYGVIYAHSLYLDFFATFGYFTGSLLMFLLFATVAWALWVSRGTESQKFLLLLVAAGLLKLFLSSTFALELFFFIMLGYCVRLIHDGRRRKEVG